MLTTHFIKILGAAVLTLLVLMPVSWQLGVTATNDPKTGTVVDANGNLRVPGDYRAAYVPDISASKRRRPGVTEGDLDGDRE
jgi:hypothetical protein